MHDINEVGIKVIQHLSGNTEEAMQIDKKVILVATNLYPSQLLRLPLEHLAGIVLEEGGATSHTAIIAKAYDIPMISGATGVLSHAQHEEQAIIDAEQGALLLQVDDATIVHYTQVHAQLQKQKSNLLSVLEQTKHKSKEGTALRFELNIDVLGELDNPICKHADGIGLFRSEFLLESIHDHHDSEYRQFQIYKTLVESMPNKRVVIRTFDSGGDKIAVSVKQVNEDNPLLGYRGIRYCLGDKEFFLYQIKALLRAAKFGNLHILIPMVSCVEEVVHTLEIIEKAKTQLRSDSIEFESHVPIGFMIEVPSLVYMLPDIAPYCDFFSVGTNDLLQYTMAADRD